MTTAIYLDHSATTPVRPEVVDAMLPFLRGAFGNPGSIHRYGREARRAIDDARDRVAALIGAEPREIVFTSGGTESDNLAVCGALESERPARRRVIVSAVEHHAVLHAAEFARTNAEAVVTILPVDIEGVIDIGALDAALDAGAALVSIMHGNNETGAIQPVEAIAALCAERGVVYHCDAVQSVGKAPIDVKRWPVGLLAISGHKLGAPKGVGACFVRDGVKLSARAVGGGQERGRRAGTENVAGIVALGKACELARAEMDDEAARLSALRDALERGLLARAPGAAVNAANAARLPHILNVSFPGADGESLVLALDTEGVAVSSGAACASGSLEPSHVLVAMGLPQDRAQAAVRFSLGRSTTPAEIDYVIELLPRIVDRVRGAATR